MYYVILYDESIQMCTNIDYFIVSICDCNSLIYYTVLNIYVFFLISLRLSRIFLQSVVHFCEGLKQWFQPFIMLMILPRGRLFCDQMSFLENI